MSKSIPSEQLQADYREIESGNFGVFSIVVEASAQVLSNLQHHKLVSLVDLKFNPDAELLAKKQQKAVRYLELPAKPDRAQ